MKLTQLSDHDLISSFKDLIIQEQEILILQLEYLAELDRRKLFFEYPSLWAYLVQECGMEETTALRRIRAARILKRFPSLKEKFESGKLNLTLLDLAQSCVSREGLSDPQFLKLIESISGMSSRSAKREIAIRYPSGVEIPHDEIKPLNAELSEVRFVAKNELLAKLEEIRGLLAHSHPGARIAELMDVMATEFLERHHPEKKLKRAEERKLRKSEQRNEEVPPAPAVHSVTTRSPNQSLIHELVKREGYRCSYVDSITNRRCDSTHGLQIDHIRSWSSGGATELENLRFLCGGHHKRISFLEFGNSARFKKRKP